MNDRIAACHWPSPRSKELERLRASSAVVGYECELEFNVRMREAPRQRFEGLRWRVLAFRLLARMIINRLARRLVSWTMGGIDGRRIEPFARKENENEIK
jgi:hypothetical protein